ncbi:MAG: ATP-binding protein [Faecalimonas umbilicata]|uniref:AlbA family DNA-binding domain-containing protein n=1 Tax=Faecalimonas umbilicata TaxID=1912855 RepID=UPI00300EEF04
MTIEEVLAVEEMQIFDRKSVNIDTKALAIPIIAFANADGGTVAIGISDKTRRIEGVDYDILKLNELLRVPFDFCIPTVKVEIEKVQCVDFKGRENHVLLMHIEPSMEVHANQADEVFMRVGDKSKKLTFEERM